MSGFCLSVSLLDRKNMKEIDRLFNDFYNVENDRFDLFSKIYKSHGTTSNFLNALFNHDCGAR